MVLFDVGLLTWPYSLRRDHTTVYLSFRITIINIKQHPHFVIKENMFICHNIGCVDLLMVSWCLRFKILRVCPWNIHFLCAPSLISQHMCAPSLISRRKHLDTKCAVTHFTTKSFNKSARRHSFSKTFN